MSGRFVPPFPPRGSGPVPVWHGLIGERARTAVAGWSERAFNDWYMSRNVFGHRVHIPLHPDMVQHVMLDNAANYVKPDLIKRLLAPTIGRGLLSSDGPLWRSQRKIVAASFTPAAVDPLVSDFARAARAISARWGGNRVRDVADEATAATMRIIADTLFAGDERLTSEVAAAHITAALGAVSEGRIQVLLGLPLMPWSRRGLAGHRGQKYLRNTLSDVVRDRLNGGPDDFLGHLIAQLRARFGDEEGIELAIDNAATFFLAGHETTANAVTWTLYLLSQQSKLQESAAREAASALAMGEEDQGLPDRLPKLRLILQESLRLYPPAPRFDRQAVADDRLGDHKVAAGDIVSIWPWLIHRHKKLWDDADAFDPERFAAGRERHRFQYLPFGGGPRLCVGARFASAEALTILAHWLARFRFEPAGDQPVRLSGAVTLRPFGGMKLKITAAGSAA